MKSYFFVLLFCPVVLFAQNKEMQPSNGATDCPTFGKKNVSSKASLFQYMRTHKPQRTQAPREQQSVYRASALPDIRQAQEDRDAALKQQERNTDKMLAKTSRKRKNRTLTDEDPAPVNRDKTVSMPEVAQAKPVQQPVSESEPAKEKSIDKTTKTKETDSSVTAEKEESASESSENATEKRDKKIRKAAFKSKMQQLFKRTNKPTSRKHVEKCPSF